jgi:hypothetical protein
MAISSRRTARYDVAFSHRIPNARQLDRLGRWRPSFVYDIDDLLLRRDPQILRRKEREEQDRLTWRLNHADAITCSSPKLMRALNAARGLDVQSRIHLLPNCGRETPPAPGPVGRSALLWASSAPRPWTPELGAIADGIEAARRALQIDIQLIGRFPPPLVQAFPRAAIHESWTPFSTFMNFADTPLVTVAPLACGKRGRNSSIASRTSTRRNMDQSVSPRHSRPPFRTESLIFLAGSRQTIRRR